MNKKIGGESFAMDGAPVMHSLPRIAWSSRSGSGVAPGVASRILLSKDVVSAHFRERVRKAATVTVPAKG